VGLPIGHLEKPRAIDVIPFGHWRGGKRNDSAPWFVDLEERYRKLSEVGIR